MTLAGKFSAKVWSYSNSSGDPHMNPRDDGSLVFVESSRGGGAQLKWHRPGEAVVSLPCSPDIRSVSSSGGGAVDWLDEDTLVYVSNVNSLVRLDMSTWQCRELVTAGESVTNIAVSPDGSLVTYVDDLHHVYVSSTDPNKSEVVRLSSGNDFAVDPAWSPDSRVVVWHEWDDPNMAWTQSRIVSRNADGTGVVSSIADDACFVNQPRFDESGDIAFISDQDGWPVPVSSNEGPLLDGHDARLEYCEPTWGPGQRSWQFTAHGLVAARSNKGFGEVVCIADGTAKVKIRCSATGMHAAPGGSRVAMIAMGPDRPTQLIVLNLADSSVEVIVQSTPLGIEQAFVMPEPVSWTATDGMVIHGRLYEPRDVERGSAPMLVYIHGGPTHRSDTTYNARVGYFVERGFSVLVPDHRGSTGWGRAYREAGYGQWGSGDLDDVACGMRAAVENGWAKEGAVIPYGGSAGGFLVLLLMMRHADLCAAGIALYPVCDLTRFADITWRFEAHYVDSLIGPMPEHMATCVERSPITHVDKLNSPLLVIHGDSDKVVPLSQSEGFVKAARSSGADVRFEVFENEGHGWKSEQSKVAELQLIEEYLRVNNLWPERESMLTSSAADADGS